MSGLDSAIAMIIASRTELLLSALRANAGSTGQTTTQTGVSLSVATPAGTAAGASAPTLAPVASAQTELSSVARTLDVISRLGGAAPAILGDAPLWPTPPRPASAFAALTTGLFDTAFSSNAAAVAAARAASQNLPPLPASALASELAKTVAQSGLFYESHLVQWMAGQRSTASLASEPQARIDPRALTLPLDLPGDESIARDTAFDDTRPPAFASTQTDLSDLHAETHNVAMPQTPQQAAALAASVRDAPALALSNSQSAPSAPASPPAAPQPSQHESALQASLDAGIHPATLTVVRQQLDILANEQFRWQGEAWPGTRFDWEVAREPRPAVDTSEERAWRTRVTLSLPALGMVDAELVLTGDKLVARLRASDTGASRFSADAAAFQRQLEAAGIALASFSVRSMDGSGAATGDIDLDAPKPVRSPLEHLFRAPPGGEVT
ncbi:flagellar hook-length control protein FliK [Caballeronia sp. LZ001]|uniref:flagellar hook-length control protein FliK n=1 Tax=Caballeronia sp. LZ001 TaxID=3038553 RepID=UPI002861AF81|nr:flagellar hook-length control protein FliK [Caballeronia sp. LZ001]MDR5803696.1 flagellar hook-length control protein FliK [Caballeronia sp. LZ001]